MLPVFQAAFSPSDAVLMSRALRPVRGGLTQWNRTHEAPSSTQIMSTEEA